MKHIEAAAWAALGLSTLALLLSPARAAALAQGFSGPAMTLLNRSTGRLSIPVAGPAAALAAVAALTQLTRGGLRRLALGLAAGFALLWLPGLAAVPASGPAEPDADALERLCVALVDALNASPLRFPTARESLSLAPAAAGLPGGAVKASVRPGWMRWLRAAGVAVPWTGEAIVDVGAHPALIPFTAVHELTHIAGVAHEGAANIAAWRRCMAAGGAFADSGRLWALRYALGMLAEADAARCARALARMEPELAALWPALGGALPPDGASPGGSYHDLARWLCDPAAFPRPLNGGARSPASVHTS